MDWIHAAEKYLPESLKTVVAPMYHNSMALANKYGLLGPSYMYGDHYYEQRREDPWRSDAQTVAKALDEEFRPESVIDFGCAIGTHLEYFYKQDIDVRGIEASKSAFEYAVIPTERIVKHDLREPYESDRQYDLAICFEVAEHIPEVHADVLIDTITDASETVVFTAASPGQGGLHHMNEQKREYWYEKFEDRNFRYDSTGVSTLRNRINVEHTDWILNNLFVFQRENES